MLLLDLVVVRGHFPGKYVNRYLDSQQRIPKNIIAPPDGDSQISPRALSLSDADSQRFLSLVVSAFCFSNLFAFGSMIIKFYNNNKTIVTHLGGHTQ